MGRSIGRLEAEVGQKGERRSLKVRCHHEAAFDEQFTAWPVFGYSLISLVETDSICLDFEKVAAQLPCFPVADLVEGFAVHDWCVGEETF